MNDRDVQFELDTLERIVTTCQWLQQHLPDLHEIAYGQGSGSGDDRVQTSRQRDLSGDLLRPARSAWHQVHQALKAALLEAQRAEYACGQQFTAGTLPDPDRPGRDTTMPKRVARQVHQAAARRRQRGEWTPTPLQGPPNDR